MVRSAVFITPMTLSTVVPFVAGATGMTLDAGNGHKIAPPPGCSLEELLIVITNTTASTKAATVKAGVDPPATRSALGDLAVPLADGSTTPQSAFLVAGSARFAQQDGSVLVDVAAGMTGRIAVFRSVRSDG